MIMPNSNNDKNVSVTNIYTEKGGDFKTLFTAALMNYLKTTPNQKQIVVKHKEAEADV